MKGPQRCISQASAKPPATPPTSHRLDVVAIEQRDERAEDQDTPMQGTEHGPVNDLFNIEPHPNFLHKSDRCGQKYLPRQ